MGDKPPLCVGHCVWAWFLHKHDLVRPDECTGYAKSPGDARSQQLQKPNTATLSGSPTSPLIGTTDVVSAFIHTPSVYLQCPPTGGRLHEGPLVRVEDLL